MENRDVSNGVERLRPVVIFCMFAQSDKAVYLEIKKHLRVQERERRIIWLELYAGSDIQQTIQGHLQRADLVLLLLSSDFLNDDHCNMAMIDALCERDKRQITVAPVKARDCNWKSSKCGHLNVLPEDDKPIIGSKNRDKVYKNVSLGITRLMDIIQTSDEPLLTHLPPFQSPKVPKDYIERSEIFSAVKRLLLNLSSDQKAARTIALWGAAGFGKTTLAIALCHDPDIKKAFPDGILWIELGKQPLQTHDLLNNLLLSLGREHANTNTRRQVFELWRKTMQERKCLLIIDDVWRLNDLEPLLENAPQCVRLITTRGDRVIPRGVEKISVEVVSKNEAIAMFCAVLPNEIQKPEYQAGIEEIVESLKRWPLLLGLASGMVRFQIENLRHTSESALQATKKIYEDRGVLAFDPSNENERRRTVGACMEASLSQLTEEFLPEQYPNYDPVQYYRELVTFPEGADIPFPTLQRFWQNTGKWHILEAETAILCTRMEKLCLLRVSRPEIGTGADTVRMHDEMHSYLQHTINKKELRHFHQQLLDAYQCSNWAELSPDEPYLWQHLAKHLINAGRGKELIATVKDGSYLVVKTHVCSAYATEIDIDLSIEQDPTDSLLLQLKRNISRINHLLNRAGNLQEVANIFHSRFLSLPEFSDICIQLEKNLTRPFLTSWHAFTDLSHEALIRTLDEHEDWVRGCAIGPKGDFIVSASFDKTLKVWNAQTGVLLDTLKGHTQEVSGCAIGPKGDFIVSASFDKTLKAWNWNTKQGKELYILQTEGISPIYGCAISPKGDFVVSCSEETLSIWDIKTRTELHVLEGHTDIVNSCAISPDGKRIISASNDGTLKVWDAQEGLELRTLSGHTGVVSGCAISPDGKWIVSASSDGTLKIWDIDTERVRTLAGHNNGISGCAISPDGKWIVSASSDGTLKIWDIDTERARTLVGHREAVYSCTVSPNGDWIVSASDDKTLKIWNIQGELESSTTINPGDRVNDCAVSPSGNYIVAALAEEVLTVWDPKTGLERFSLKGHDYWVRGCAVSPDGSRIVSAASDGTLKVWSSETEKELLTLQGHNGQVLGCAISPDGNWIVSASDDKTLKIWNTSTGEELCTLRGHIGSATGCAISPLGDFIISTSADETLKIWSSKTGEELLTLSGHGGPVTDCAISPDGNWVVSASDDGTLKLWNTRTGQELHTFTGHAGKVNGCTISPDGNWVVSASDDGTLKVWGTRNGINCATLRIGSKLQTCTFFLDGIYLVAGGDNGIYFLKLIQ